MTEAANGIAGLVAVVSGIAAGIARSLATLLDRPREGVDRTTAVAFLLAIVFVCLFLLAVAGLGG